MMRLRFAPSPTGYLHLGNARTALFNYLLARRHRGALVLRIEDTDTGRGRPEYEAGIRRDLAWLGIDWDEGPDCGGPHGPYRQSERLDYYQSVCRRLLDGGHAYHCYCSPAELEARRREQAARKESPRYDNRCRTLTDAQRSAFVAAGRPAVVRFRLPGEPVVFQDLIRGEITFDTALMGDTVIMRPDGWPSFHLAVVADDIAMEISHVVRGEDHISNTPRHLLLFEALGARPPRFAHMAMTLGPDGSRLSKRHGATSVRELERQGFLPEAVFNYLALLGWGTTEDRDVYSRDELVARFSLDRCKQGGAVFDFDKLTWLNGLYLQQAERGRLVELALPFLQDAGLLGPTVSAADRARVASVLAALGDRVRKLADLPEAAAGFLGDGDPEYAAADVERVMSRSGAAACAGLAALAGPLSAAADFTAPALETLVRDFCRREGLKTGALFHPLRLAVTGKTVGPSLFDALELVGRERTVARLQNFLRLAAVRCHDPAAGE